MGTKEAFLLFVAAALMVSAQEGRDKKLCSIDLLRSFVLDRIDQIKIDLNQNDWQYMAKKKNGLDGQLLIEFKDITEKMGKFSAPKLPENIMDSLWSYATIDMEKTNINGFYTTLKRFQANPDSLLFKDSWTDYASACINNSPNKHSVLKSLGIIQDMIFDNVEGHKNLFQSLEDYNNMKCEQDQSVQQLLYNIYTDLQIIQLKAYTMIQFSWMLLRLYNKGNFTSESELLKQHYTERIAQQANIVVREMKGASNDIYKCDPPIHIKEETYTEITKFLQGFIVNEVDLNKENTCSENCQFYRYTKQQGCFKNQFCSKQPACKGNVVGCNFVDSDMWVCQGPASSNRRYDWIEYENGRTLGLKGSCSRAVTQVDSWWRWLFWHCSYCFCFCDDPSDQKSHRYFNMRSVLSDVTNNKVVTGIRFIKSNKVIHLQIQEGELIQNGQINATNISWRPIDNYNIDEVDVGVDYHMLTWEHRAIDLDDLIAPENHVVTGVRFRRVGGHLNLEIQVSELNFASGKLVGAGDKSQWISNDNTDGAYYKPRTRITMKNPDNPTRNSGITSIDSKPDQFIEFTNSDLDLDAGQTTVPYIDTQLVAPNPPVPLVGVGIYHKGRKYSGGFIAPKVFTYDYSSHILNFFPELNEAEF